MHCMADRTSYCTAYCTMCSNYAALPAGLQDGRTMLSRALDDTMKVWDLRALKQPLAVMDGLPTTYPTTRYPTISHVTMSHLHPT